MKGKNGGIKKNKNLSIKNIKMINFIKKINIIISFKKIN